MNYFFLIIIGVGLCKVVNGLDLNGLFYIYEWPNVPISAYPDKSALLHPNASYSHAFSGNNGLGDLFDSEIGLFQTWQFGLFRPIFNRLLTHPKRTRYAINF